MGFDSEKKLLCRPLRRLMGLGFGGGFEVMEPWRRRRRIDG